ncbi:uncharacterized protein LOC141691472 [Apium graveolens]|uniref:uncharacterized protein LOC141691472 n=1 Tax=Apium graveolens TaxID=4045 RepID=UPI003D792385
MVVSTAPDVLKLLESIAIRKEELRLFQFLNGLDEQYNTQHSHLLMQIPLPTVETSYATLEQEEAQIMLLGTNIPKTQTDLMVMYTEYNPDRIVTCIVCGTRGYSSTKFWQVIGYARWHPKSGNFVPQPKRHLVTSQNRWPKPTTPGPQKMATSVQKESLSANSGLLFTPQQLEQLSQIVPHFSQLQTNQDKATFDEELDYHFSGVISCHNAHNMEIEWIVDFGASEHMTPHHSAIFNPSYLLSNQRIQLPTGDSVIISHSGQAQLIPDLALYNVLCVPIFQHNLLSVQKLIKDGKFNIIFHSTHCEIDDKTTGLIKMIGTVRNGLYYINTSNYLACNTSHPSPLDLWHHKLGHASLSSFKHIPDVPIGSVPSSQICASCPMSKFTVLPFSLSTSHAKKLFALLHMDIWGLYKVPYISKYRYFLILVDDFSRNTWVYLLNINLIVYKTSNLSLYCVVEPLYESDNDHYTPPTSPDHHILNTPDAENFKNLVDPQSNHESPVAPTDTLPVRISSRLHKQPVWMQDYVPSKALHVVSNLANTSINPSFSCFLSNVTENPDLTSFKTATTQDRWVSAMNSELDALELNETRDKVPLPAGKIAIGCKWIFKTKYKADGSIDKHKGRLVILGCHQKPGEDFSEIFAHVVKLTTVRTLLAVAAKENWFTFQMNVSNAFLHVELSENVYMKLPQGYNTVGSRLTTNMVVTKSPSHMVCKLNKSLYGLRQAPRLWFFKLSSTLLQLGYKQSKADSSLFSYHTLNTITVVLVFVDDLLISGTCMNSTTSLKQMLSQSFHMKDLGQLRHFLGIEVDRNVDGIFLS